MNNDYAKRFHINYIKTTINTHQFTINTILKFQKQESQHKTRATKIPIRSTPGRFSKRKLQISDFTFSLATERSRTLANHKTTCTQYNENFS